MGSTANQGYCAFTKAVEHLGDRWSFLIVRELARYGPQGFSALATGIPGHISRSVLASKLRKLEELGLVARESPVTRASSYRLAPAGEQLVPTLMSLWDWAEHWVPEDPAFAERDPTVITAWLQHRVERDVVPEQPVAIELAPRGAMTERVWLLLARGTEPSLCLEDPMLESERYLYVEADAAVLYRIARGLIGWEGAMANRSVSVYGDPTLVRGLPGWFRPAEHGEGAAASAAVA